MKINSLYRTLGPKVLDNHHKHRGDQETTHPSREEIAEYWKEVIGVRGDFDPDNPKIKSWKQSVDSLGIEGDTEPMEDYTAGRSAWETV